MPPCPPHSRNRGLRAALVFLLVLGGHWAVLGAATAPWGTPLPPAAQTLVYEARLLPTTAATPPQAQRAPMPPRPAPRPSRQPGPQPFAASDIAADTPAVAAPQDAPMLLAAAEKTDGAGAAARPLDAVAAASRPPVLPDSVRLLYDIKGEIKRIPISANGELLWRQDGKTYDARLEISIFLLGSRVQTSKGLIGPLGLEPVRFGDKVRSEVAAHFERGKGKVTYSANTPDEVLQPGAQDQLSIFFQLAGMVAADPQRYAPGTDLSFQAVGPRSSATWTFKLAAPEIVVLPGGRVRAIRLSKDPVGEYDSRAEVWLAPELGYLPVRIRLTQGNGDIVDQLWRATEPAPAKPAP